MIATGRLDLTVLVPTKNESESIPLLVKRLTGELEHSDLRWELLFVDDSDDDTPEVILDLRDDHHRIRLLHRDPDDRAGGLSGALDRGLRTSDAAVCAVMDADLQHPPELVSTLVEPIIHGECDVAIASRYVRGGSAVGLDGPFRHFVSRASADVARALFPCIRAVKDPGSGFFALRRDVIDSVELRPEGFKMLVEILVRGRWRTFREVPYDFGGRMYGASKVSVRLGVHFLTHMGRLWSDVHFPRYSEPTPPPARAITLGHTGPVARQKRQLRRVLVIASEVAPTVSGVSHTAGRLTEEFIARGIEVDTLTTADARSFRHGEIRLSSLGWKTARLDGLADRYDVISVHGPAPMISDAILLARRLQPHHFPPLVYTHHFTVELEGFGFGNKLYDHVHRRLARWADHVIVTTPSYLRMLCGGALGSGRPITAIPWGVDRTRFGSLSRRSYDGTGPMRVLFVGQQRAYKGVPLLIRAVAGIDELELTVVGDGPLANDHRDMAGMLRASNVTFRGRVTEQELADVLSDHDVIALPSINRLEAFGLVLLEGMSAGCVPVASDLPGLCDVAATTGVLVPPNDSHALRAALLHLARHPEQVAAKQRASVELAARYDWSTTVDDYLDIFTMVANRDNRVRPHPVTARGVE